MKKFIIFCLLLFLNITFLFADVEPSRNDLESIFPYEDYETDGFGLCRPQCRVVNEEKYVTKIINFDSKSGITSCDVYPKFNINNNQRLSIQANTLNTTCTSEQQAIQPDYTDSTLASKTSNDYSSHATISDYKPSNTTMSKFIGGLITLDEDVVMIKDTIDTATLSKTNPASVYSPDSGDEDNPNELLNQIDSLNTQNLAFFVDMFYWGDTLMEYLISYIFVFISLISLVLFAGKIGFKKLERKSTSLDQPWSAHFTIIVFSVVLFLLPFKYDDNYSSTLFQNICKYFVSESISIADEFNKSSLRSFVNYTYSTTGASSIEQEANLKAMLKKEQLAISAYENALSVCEERFPGETTYQIPQENLEHIQNFAGNIDDNSITLTACRSIERKAKLSYTKASQLKYHLQRIYSAYKDSEITDRLSKVSTLLDRRSDELGWFSVILAPSVKIMTELSFLSSNETPPLNEEIMGKIRDTQTKIEPQENWLQDLLAQGNQFAKDIMGETLAKVVYLVFPGAGALFSFFYEMGLSSSVLLNMLPGVGIQLSILGQASTPFISLYLVSFIVTYILSFIPLLTGTIASILALVLWIYDLILYVLTGPFVVAYAVTTTQSKKLLEYLVTGLRLFLTPVIIVLSVYLSLFLYSFIQDNILVFSSEQFALLENSTDGFTITMFSYIIKELLSIFGLLLSIYIIWKLIVNGKDHIFKLIGLDTLSHYSNLGDQISENYRGRYSFNA